MTHKPNDEVKITANFEGCGSAALEGVSAPNAIELHDPTPHCRVALVSAAQLTPPLLEDVAADGVVVVISGARPGSQVTVPYFTPPE